MRAPKTARIRADNIVIPGWHGRVVADDKGLEGLAESIQSHGQLQPIVVRPLGDGRYELVAGWRRLNAARAAGLEEVEAKVVECSGEEAKLMVLEENMKRRDIPPFDAARIVASLHIEDGLQVAEIARRLRISSPLVSKLLRIHSITPEAKSDMDRLLLHGWCQLQLELHALGLERGRLLVYRYADNSLEEVDVEYSWEAANMLLETYRQVLGLRRRCVEELRRLLA